MTFVYLIFGHKIYAYQQCYVITRFKENEKFIAIVREPEVNNSTMILKVDIVKLIDKYPQPIMSSVTLNILKAFFRDIKIVKKIQINLNRQRIFLNCITFLRYTYTYRYRYRYTYTWDYIHSKNSTAEVSRFLEFVWPFWNLIHHRVQKYQPLWKRLLRWF